MSAETCSHCWVKTSVAHPIPGSIIAPRETGAADCTVVNARSALFDVYGDHLRPRGGAAPVAALLRMLAPLEVAAPAVRTAISRMVRQGWLVPMRLDQGAGYRMTPQAERRLSAAASRIYRRGIAPWDGRWHVLVIDHIAPNDPQAALELNRFESARDPSHTRTLADVDLRGMFEANSLVLLRSEIEREKEEISAYLDRAGCQGEDRERALAVAPGHFYTKEIGWYLLRKPGL